ncbi:MAG TPA: hypothetical protein VKV15_12205 [Bryobacteraceae bacterium]|nr:hypothetical protein [Bryobacteraceae bacterium]
MKLLVVLLAASVVQPKIPKTWNQTAITTLELPLANPRYSAIHVSEETYYRIPERVIYKNYPVYYPGREPAGYMEWLRNRKPEIAFVPSQLKTHGDWVKAGELVFNAPTSYNPVFFSAADVRDPLFYKQTGMPVAADGTIPFARWVIRQKGVVELGSMGCNTCHTRVLADGTVVPGAQGNNPNDREGARMLQLAAKAAGPASILTHIRAFARQFEMPWLPDDPNARVETMPLNELIAAGEAIPPGVTARSNTSMFVPPQIPDLIGIEGRRYLDHTGLVQQRDIGDLMRYSSLMEDLFTLDRHGDSEPAKRVSAHMSRYSDEQLYALALYLYSLQPPPDPNKFDAIARRGKAVFQREGCARCHTPPLYTNNKLIPVDGFNPPAADKARFDIMDARIGTDPRYALETRKGTGYYKVPSLKGVWYRGPFEHNGEAATLEDWFDAARLTATYVPTGFKGYDGKTRSVKGHPFGLDLSPVDKKALIAFLKTL